MSECFQLEANLKRMEYVNPMSKTASEYIYSPEHQHSVFTVCQDVIVGVYRFMVPVA
jgi:hypothetical protein